MTKITPSPNRSKPPRFQDLDDEVFEELCCALLEREPNITKADLYKSKRQPQYGADVIGETSNSDFEYVVSCKVRQTLKKGDIPDFGDEFLKHWETHWKDKNVKEFVLAVTYPTNSDQREKEVESEKKRFKKLGIKYSVWPPRTLLAKVRPHREIAAQYLTDQVAEQICGQAQPPIAPSNSGQIYLDAAMIQQIADLQKALTGKIEKQLQHAREQIRRKEGDKVDELLKSIVDENAQWTALSNETKGAVKRLMGSRALHKDDIELAKTLCAEAEKFDPNKIGTLKALIALVEEGIRPALKLLTNASTPESLRLRAGLHISLSDIPQGLEDLDSLEEEDRDGEALRLYALAYMMEGDRAEAFSYIERAQESYGDWYAVQHSSMMMHFHAGYSPLVSFQPSAWPNPIIAEFVREDAEGQAHLATGLEILDKLLKKSEDDQQERNDLKVWRLAYLSNLKNHSLEAETYANEVLKDNPANAGVIMWSLARGYNFDTDESIQGLSDLIQSKKAEFEDVLSLAAIHLIQDNKVEALAVLENNKNLFDKPELIGAWEHWHFKSTLDSKSSLPRKGDMDELLAFQIQKSVNGNDWASLVKFLADNESGNLELTHIFIACWNFAISKNWPYVEPYISKLVQIQTAEAVRLAAWGAYHAGKTYEVLNILDQNLHVFYEQKLPADLRRLRVRASSAEGDFSVAVEESKKLSSDTNDKEDRLGYIESLLYIGDTQRAAPLIRDTLKEGHLTSITSLQLSNAIEGTDPLLARQLLENVEIDDLSDELAVAFYGRAMQAGLAQAENLFHTRLQAVAEAQPNLIRKLNQEELNDFIAGLNARSQNADNLYKQGNVPVHFTSSVQGTTMAELVFGNFSSKQLLP